MERAGVEGPAVAAANVEGPFSDEVPSGLPGHGRGKHRATDASPAAATPSYDSWELEQRLQHIERILAAGSREAAERSDVTRGEKGSRTRLRHDAAHAVFNGPHARTSPKKRFRGRRFSQTIVWSMLLIGITSLACGSFLVGWSRFAGREELGSIGLPIALAGGICLLVALIVQVDRLLNDNRLAASKLDMVDHQLHRLAAAAGEFNGPQRHSPSDAFYAHLAGGASPQLLLSDLKSQLDMLAVQIGLREAE